MTPTVDFFSPHVTELEEATVQWMKNIHHGRKVKGRKPQDTTSKKTFN